MRLFAALALAVSIAAPAAAGGPVAAEGASAASNAAAARPANAPMIRPQIPAVAPEAWTSKGLQPQPLETRQRMMVAKVLTDKAAMSALLDQADAVAAQTLYASDDATSLQVLAEDIETLVTLYNAGLSGAQVRKLELLRRQAQTLLSAQATAKALGTGRAAEEIAGSERVVRPELASPGEKSSITPSAPVAAKPAAPVLKTAEKGQEPEKGFNWFMAMIYAGAVLIMGAFGWFVLYNWMVLGPAGIMLLSGGIAAGLYLLGRRIGDEKFPKTAGVLNATVVGMAPLFTYGFLALIGKTPGTYHDYYLNVNLGWVAMELATIGAAVAMAIFGRAKSAMVAFPAAIAAWFMSMDLARAFTGTSVLTWSETHAWFSVVSGLLMMAISRGIERLTKIDYPFWVYLAGLLAFSGGLAMLPASNEVGRFLFAATHVGLIGAGLYLKRKTFAVFGTIGALAYIGHLATLFAAEISFPLALGFFGVTLIVSAVLIQRNLPAIKAWLKKRFPTQA